MRAGLASVMLFVLFISGIAGYGPDDRHRDRCCRVAAFLIYVPLGYKVDRMFWERRMRKAGRPLPPQGRAQALMDVRTFTVGPVQENCHIARLDGARAGDRDRPRRRGAAAARGDRGARASRSRRSCSRTRTSTTSAPSRRSRAPPARRSGAPSSRSPVLADIMRYVPWEGFGPFESYDADHTRGRRRAARARRAGDRRAVHARALAGPRDVLDPGRAGDLLRRRAVRRARSAAPTCPAATTRR